MDTRTLSCAETAKLVRAALKAAFPGVKFSVRSDTYSGGASIDVHWIDGPTTDEVEQLTNRYRRNDFDGMTDSMNRRDDTLIARPGGDVDLVRFGADFIFGHRSLSPARLKELETVAAEILGEPVEYGRWYEDQVTPYGVWQGCTGKHLLGWLGERVPSAAG